MDNEFHDDVNQRAIVMEQNNAVEAMDTEDGKLAFFPNPL